MPERTKTIDVFARANLTLQGQLLPVYEIATLEWTDEVQACIDNQTLVPRGEDGGFADLGPIGIPVTPPGQRCCGK